MSDWKWGRRSLEVRDEIHVSLATLADIVLYISPFDLALTEGRRDIKAQTEAYRSGASELSWPASKHNRLPPELSDACHLDPYPIDYVNTQRYYILAGLMMAVAHEHEIEVRWLGLTTLRDLAHWEIV